MYVLRSYMYKVVTSIQLYRTLSKDMKRRLINFVMLSPFHGNVVESMDKVVLELFHDLMPLTRPASPEFLRFALGDVVQHSTVALNRCLFG